MMEPAENCPKSPRIAVGIVVDKDTIPFLDKTIASAKTLSQYIFVLAVGKDITVDIAVEGEKTPDNENPDNHVAVHYGGWHHDEASTRNMLIDYVEQAEVADSLIWMNPGDEFDASTKEVFFHFLENESHSDFLYMMVSHRLFREDGIRHDFDEETIEARLMPLGQGIRFQGRVKATIIPRNADLTTQISAAPGRFFVLSKQKAPTKTVARAKQTLEILKKMEQEGELIQDDLLAARAEAQFLAKDFANARQTFLTLTETAERPDLQLSAYYAIWETTEQVPMPDAEITKLLIEALDKYPIDMQLLTFLGSHMQRVGKLDMAVKTFETAIQHGKISIDVWHRLRIREIAITSLALCYRLQNKQADALRVLESHADDIEDRTEFDRHLLDLYIAENQEEAAAQLAGKALSGINFDNVKLTIRGACLAKTGRWDNAVAPLEEAYEKGCKDVLCLRWYALALLAHTQFEKAADILNEWLTIQPENTEAKSYLAAAQRPEQFSETLGRIRDAHLRVLGMLPDKPRQRKLNIKVEDAVREMIQSSGACGKIITGFKPKTNPVGK